MDTKTLAVGQAVVLSIWGPYGHWGVVVNVSPSGCVDVQAAPDERIFELLHFDSDGNETGTSHRNRGGWGPDPGSGPFELERIMTEQEVQESKRGRERREARRPAHEAAKQQVRDFARSKVKE
jgi:hypothetical protein